MHASPPNNPGLPGQRHERSAAKPTTNREADDRPVPVSARRTRTHWDAVLRKLGALVVLVGVFASVEGLAAEPSAGPQRMQQLFAELHSEDANVAKAAEKALRDVGVDEVQLALGKALADPSEQARVQLAGTLARVRPDLRDTVVVQLASDESPTVRVALLENVRGVGIGPKSLTAIRQLADGDEDARVRGYARLLVADWDASMPEPVAALPTVPTAPATRPPRSRPVPPIDFAPPSGPSVVQTAAPFPGIAPIEMPTVDAIRPAEPAFAGYPAEAIPPFEDPAAATHDRPASGLRSYWIDEESEDLITQAGYDDETAEDRPGVLGRPLGDEPTEQPFVDPLPPDYTNEFIVTEQNAPWGFTGPSGVLPTEFQTSPHFVPVEDRWRLGLEPWDRYGKEHAGIDDYPGQEGHWWDPFNQNVLKGDYPIVGQHTFLNVTAQSFTTLEWREVPTGTTPFESTKNANQEEFFGDPAQTFVNQNLMLQMTLFHGNAAFKPIDWQVRLTPIVNFNYLDVNELAVVNPDVTKGTRRSRDHVTLQEYFLEAKIADLGPDYDFVSARAGNQFFNSDFRGHIFFDTNRGIRLFGSRFGNRDQFNLAFFDMVEKETNSELNTFDDRHQNVFIANYYRQDFIFPGYTAQASLHYNRDTGSTLFDRNDFLVRPDPAGIFKEHEVDAVYLGFAGEGHIERFNYSNVLYWVVGKDSNNPIAGRSQDIDAYMGAIELSYDRDWIRFRASFFYASGDDDLFDNKAEGFDTIIDDVNFAGGNFSYWQRNAIRLFGVNVTQRKSLVANLRSSKIQGQSNFVNPGLVLVNGGMDFEITPKTRVITNVNYLWFDSTTPLEVFSFQDRIDPEIGVDMSLGIEYRPLLSDNVIMLFGISSLVPGSGFTDLFGKTVPFEIENTGNVKADPLYAAFFELVMTY